jgi:ketosteroid isomerase-like protein
VSDRNVDIVRRLADAIDTGDLPREILTDDFELKNATTAVTDATYHGYEGAPVDLRWASVFWFRDEKIARVAGFNSRRAALEAVGLA